MQGPGVRVVLAAAAVACVLAIPRDAQAQWRRRPPHGARGRPGSFAPFFPRALPEFGVRGGYDFDTRSGSLGADLRLPLGPRGHLAVAPSGDFFFDTPGHDWQLNLDGELRAPLLGLYGGGGGALIHHSFEQVLVATPGGGVVAAPADRETKLGWNLFAGLEPGFAPLRPFVETRWTFRGDHYSAFRLVGGLRVPLGGHGHRWRRGRR